MTAEGYVSASAISADCSFSHTLDTIGSKSETDAERRSFVILLELTGIPTHGVIVLVMLQRREWKLTEINFLQELHVSL